jgi:hypothetical protein
MVLMFMEKSLDVYERFAELLHWLRWAMSSNYWTISVIDAKSNLGFFMTLLRGGVAVEAINRRYVISNQPVSIKPDGMRKQPRRRTQTDTRRTFCR